MYIYMRTNILLNMFLLICINIYIFLSFSQVRAPFYPKYTASAVKNRKRNCKQWNDPQM